MTKQQTTKRSLRVDGHKTSITVEDIFWSGLKEIAHLQRVKVPKLISAIDANRNNSNLSSAVRVFVLEHFRNKRERTDLLPRPKTSDDKSQSTQA